MSSKFEIIYSKRKISKEIFNYLTKEELTNLSLCSKSLYSIINKENYIFLEVLGSSRAP
jgi:hypothetical protein